MLVLNLRMNNDKPPNYILPNEDPVEPLEQVPRPVNLWPELILLFGVLGIILYFLAELLGRTPHNIL